MTVSKIIDLGIVARQALVLHMYVLIRTASSWIRLQVAEADGRDDAGSVGRAWRMGGSFWVLGTVVVVAFCAGGLAGILLAALMHVARGEPTPDWPD